MAGFASQGLLAFTQGIAGATKGAAETATLHAKNEIVKEQNAETARLAQERLRMADDFKRKGADVKHMHDLDAADKLEKAKERGLLQQDVFNKENLLLESGYKTKEQKAELASLEKRAEGAAAEQQRATEARERAAKESNATARAELEVGALVSMAKMANESSMNDAKIVAAMELLTVGDQAKAIREMKKNKVDYYDIKTRLKETELGITSKQEMQDKTLTFKREQEASLMIRHTENIAAEWKMKKLGANTQVAIQTLAGSQKTQQQKLDHINTLSKGDQELANQLQIILANTTARWRELGTQYKYQDMLNDKGYTKDKFIANAKIVADKAMADAGNTSREGMNNVRVKATKAVAAMRRAGAAKAVVDAEGQMHFFRDGKEITDPAIAGIRFDANKDVVEKSMILAVLQAMNYAEEQYAKNKTPAERQWRGTLAGIFKSVTGHTLRSLTKDPGEVTEAKDTEVRFQKELGEYMGNKDKMAPPRNKPAPELGDFNEPPALKSKASNTPLMPALLNQYPPIS